MQGVQGEGTEAESMKYTYKNLKLDNGNTIHYKITDEGKKWRNCDLEKFRINYHTLKGCGITATQSIGHATDKNLMSNILLS